MNIIECINLNREFIIGNKKNRSKFNALADINLEVKKGDIFGILGTNGAGKTTLIKIICTLLYPTSGTVIVNGYNVMKDDKQIKKNIGVLLSNNRSLYLKLTAWENLDFFSGLYLVPNKIKNSRIEKILKLINLWDRRNDYVENFSHGMMQRLNIGRAIINDPCLIILDEPTNGLDPESTIALRQIILQLNNEGKTILLTTHNMYEADILSTQIAIIDKGKKIVERIPEVLKRNIGKNVYEFHINKNQYFQNIDILKNAINYDIQIAENLDSDTYVLKFIANDDMDLQKLVHILSNVNVCVENIGRRNTTLEDVFLSVSKNL